MNNMDDLNKLVDTPFFKEPDFSDIPSTEIDKREYRALRMKTEREWRDYWICRMHKYGFSNVEIAKRLDLSENTVRLVIKGK